MLRAFGSRDLEEALAHAAAGGQGLHLHRIIVDERKAPRCFIRAVARGEPIAHLFDQDKVRLLRTARMLGVRVLVVEREGTPRQHIDLCGQPLHRAALLCENHEEALAIWEGESSTEDA